MGIINATDEIRVPREICTAPLLYEQRCLRPKGLFPQKGAVSKKSQTGMPVKSKNHAKPTQIAGSRGLASPLVGILKG